MARRANLGLFHRRPCKIPSLKVFHTITELREHRRATDPLIALVPTMGALHEGHLKLIEEAKRLTDEVWVSIFVNPTQFNESSDLAHYPRPIEADLAACEKMGVSVVFNPEPDEVYPPGVVASSVDVPSLTTQFEGAHRPGHFAGVCRVVLKLMNLCEPRFVCFGQKDYQQMIVIEAMAADLNLPLLIQRVPTVREADGLAMSSRNQRLSEEERKHAVGLFKALTLAQQMIKEDEHFDSETIESAMRQAMQAHHIEPDYAAIRHPVTLEPVDLIDGEVVALVAGRLGSVRLLDNFLI